MGGVHRRGRTLSHREGQPDGHALDVNSRFPSRMELAAAKATGTEAKAGQRQRVVAAGADGGTGVGGGGLPLGVLVRGGGGISCGVGAVRVPVWGGLAMGRGALTETERVIVLEIRLPRVLASGVVGAGLATAGSALSGVVSESDGGSLCDRVFGGAVVGPRWGSVFFAGTRWLGFSARRRCWRLWDRWGRWWWFTFWRGRRAGTNVVALLLAGFAVSTMLGSQHISVRGAGSGPGATGRG